MWQGIRKNNFTVDVEHEICVNRDLRAVDVYMNYSEERRFYFRSFRLNLEYGSLSPVFSSLCTCGARYLARVLIGR